MENSKTKCKLTTKTQIDLVKVLNTMVQRYNYGEEGLNFVEVRDFQNYLEIENNINLAEINRLINL